MPRSLPSLHWVMLIAFAAASTAPARTAPATPARAASAAPARATSAAPPLPVSALRALTAGVSEERIAATIRRLEAFGTRHTYSGGPEWKDPGHGIDAARLWIAEQLHNASPRLQVGFELSKLTETPPRLFRSGELRNVLAILPAATEEGRKRQIILSGHYDSVAADADGTIHWDRPELPAPGANDDASGVAVVLEAARVLAKGSFDADLVFIAFAGEEQGLEGGAAHALHAGAASRRGGARVEGVLNNDIVGGIRGGDGRVEEGAVRVFSEGPEDSASRELARLASEIAREVVPGFRVDLVLRPDRFGRGGDHLPFNRLGMAGVRFTSAVEDYSRQHSVRDTADGTSAAYAARVARVNIAAAADLAAAPPVPVVTDEKGAPTLDRGPTGYDVRLRWKPGGTADDLAGYLVLERQTTSPVWQRSHWAGRTEEFTIPGVSIDGLVFGVRAVDTEGHQSPAAVFVQQSWFPRRWDSPDWSPERLDALNPEEGFEPWPPPSNAPGGAHDPAPARPPDPPRQDSR